MLLRHLLDRPGDRALLWHQTGVDVDLVFAFNMAADDSEVGDDLAIILDIEDLACGGFGHAAGAMLIV